MLKRNPKREKCEERDRQLAREREIPCRHLFLCVSVSVSKTHLQNKKYSRILNETITQRRKTGISAMKEIRKKNHSLTNSCYILCWCAKWGACALRYIQDTKALRAIKAHMRTVSMYAYLPVESNENAVREIRSSKACTSYTQRRSPHHHTCEPLANERQPKKTTHERNTSDRYTHTNTHTHTHSLNAHARSTRSHLCIHIILSHFYSGVTYLAACAVLMLLPH